MLKTAGQLIEANFGSELKRVLPHFTTFFLLLLTRSKSAGVMCMHLWAGLSKYSSTLCRKTSALIWKHYSTAWNGFQMRLHRQILTWPINTPTTTIITCASPSGSLSSHRQESVLWFLDRGSYCSLFVQSARPHKEFQPSNLLTKQDSNYTGR